MDTRSWSSMDVLRTEFDIFASGSLFWSNTADYLTLNRRLLDATHTLPEPARADQSLVSRELSDIRSVMRPFNTQLPR